MTQILNVHAIFGAFLAGTIVPHHKRFAISITEKLEELVSIMFIPVYLTYSGLQTDFLVLNDWKYAGYFILIISFAFISKMVGPVISARYNQYSWKDSLAVGLLMNTRGFQGIVILNLG